VHIQDAKNLIKNALSTHKLLQKIKGEALKVNEGTELDFSPGKQNVYARLHAASFRSLQSLDKKGCGESSHQGSHVSQESSIEMTSSPKTGRSRAGK